MLWQVAGAVCSPHTIAFLCKLSAIAAIVAFATAGFSTGLMLNVYTYASRCATPPSCVPKDAEIYWSHAEERVSHTEGNVPFLSMETIMLTRMR